MISQQLVDEFKLRNHLTSEVTDSNVEALLRSSYAMIKSYCGNFDIEKNEVGKELVMERARYAYNGVPEMFYPNYRHDLHNLGLMLAG